MVQHKTFESTQQGLKGHTYDAWASKDTAQFKKSLKKIAYCIQKNCDNGTDVTEAMQKIEYLDLQLLPIPMDIKDENIQVVLQVNKNKWFMWSKD